MGELTRNSIFGRFGFQDGIDANSLTRMGIYYLRENTINALDWSYLIVFEIQEGYIVQINVAVSISDLKIRVCSGTIWKNWRKVLLE